MRLSIISLPALAALAAAGCAPDSDQVAQGNANVGPAAPADSPLAEAPAQPPVTGRLDRSHAGTPAPGVTFENGEGQPTSLAAFRGRPVLVNLWATWCAPCVVEMPSLDALAVREGDGLQVVTLSQDIAGREAVTRFFERYKFKALEAHLDKEMAFMGALKLSTLPTTILYDAEGKEVWRMVQTADWTSERIAKLLAEAEAG